MNISDLWQLIGGMAGDSLDAQFRWWLAGFVGGWSLCLLNLCVRVLRWAATPGSGAGVKTEL